MRKLKTLNDFNAKKWEEYEVIRESQQPHPNGIACPKCGKELWDGNPMTTLPSDPPKKNIDCPECGYRGYRWA